METVATVYLMQNDLLLTLSTPINEYIPSCWFENISVGFGKKWKTLKVNIYMNFLKKIILLNVWMVSIFELWDVIIPIPFIKDHPVCPVLGEVIMKHWMTFRQYLENSKSCYGCHADTSGSLNSVRNLPKWNWLFDRTPALLWSQGTAVSTYRAALLEPC